MHHTIFTPPAPVNSVGSAQRRIHRIETSFSTRQLVGRVRLTLKPDMISSDSLRIKIVLRDKFEYQVVDATVTSNQSEFAFDGTFAESMEVSIAGAQGDQNPVEMMSIDQIVLAAKRRILLLGDSITEVHYDTTGQVTWGYRHRLYHKLVNEYPDIDFVGTSGDDPYEAHCDGGTRISAFCQNGSMDVRSPMNTHRPHIVAIHLGTNDINNYEKPVETAENMRRLINYLLQWRYDENGAALDENIRLQHIIVSLVIPAKYRDELSIETNRYLALVVDDFVAGRETGRPEPVIITDHFSRFREWPTFHQLMWDRLHPNNSGHEVMAATYFRTFATILSEQADRTWFTDISFQANIIGTDYNYIDNSTTEFLNQGVAVADVTGDGQDDIYFTRTDYGNNKSHDELYIWHPSFPYVNRTDDFKIMDNGGSRGAVFVDIDNDGDFDLFNGNSPGPNALYENQNDNGFIRLTHAGIEEINALTVGVTAFDADNDGDMDLLAVNSKSVNEFYRNDGPGRFTPVESELRDLAGASFSNYMAAPADFDNDGDTDIFMTYRDAAGKLFANDGAGNFVDVTSQAGLYYNGRTNGASWTDLDLDGDLDLVLTESRVSESSAKFLRLYENNGDGAFSDNTSQFNIPVDGFSTIIADFNNDGFDDIITAFEKEQCEFWQNRGNWAFEKISETGADIHGSDVRGAAVLDYDDDGDVDILMARSDMLNVMLRNNYSRNEHYLKAKANGPGGTKGGFGTRIWLYETGHLHDPNYLVGHREIVSTSGHISQSSPTLHFGLGFHSSVDVLARFTDGSFLSQRAIPANRTIIVEPLASVAGEPARISYHAGGDQQAPVGELLPHPLEVQVMDENSAGVPGVTVPFRVTQGAAQLLLPNTTADKISLEAENGQFRAPLFRANAGDAAGGAYVFAHAFVPGDGSSIVWQKEVNTTADYFLWLRLANSSGTSQIISLTIDGVLRNASAAADPMWRWLRVSSDNGYRLQAGAHAFEIRANIPGMQIDKLLLVRDGDYAPVGLEERADAPDVTDSQGIARRSVQLGTRAEEILVEASLQVEGQPLPDSPVIFHLKAVPGPAARLDKTSGDEQTGAPGVELPQPFVVTAYDVLDNPVPQTLVTFSSLCGRLQPSSSMLTDEIGRAAVRYTPDGSSSRQKIEAKIDGISPVSFTTFVTGVAVKLELLSQAHDSGTVMQPLSAPIRVRVMVDSLKNEPAIGYPVEFTTANKGGRLAASNVSSSDSTLVVETDENGIAQAYWRLGEKSGTQTLIVNAGNISGSPRLVTALAHPASPALLLLVSGNEQSGAVGSRLDKAFQVRVTDLYRNPVADMQVRFTSTFDGTLEGSSSTMKRTNVLGEASCFYTFGSTSGYAHVARVEAYDKDRRIGSPVDFYATALPGSAATSAIHAGDKQIGTVDTDAPHPLAIIVKDEFGNPAAASVTFTAIDGGLFAGQESVSILTEADGIASAVYRIGKTAGRQRVRADCPGLSPSHHLFLIQALPADPTKISDISGNHQTGSRNTRLPTPLVVRITDRYGNGVIGFPVTFTVSSDNGSLGGKREIAVSTDSSGYSSAQLTLGDELGEDTNIVQAAGNYNGLPLRNSPIIFYASAHVGQPHAMYVLSDTTHLFGAANHELPQPIMVKIADKDGQAIADFTVQCRISDGSGYFQENGKKSIDLKTDADGLVSIRWVLGGLGEQQRLIIIAIDEGKHLANSPLTISASTVSSTAKELVIISGDNQSGARGEALKNPFVVKIVDTFDDPVSGHTVFFRVAKGDGSFIASGTPSYAMKTDAQGTAAAFFRLGQAAGYKAYEIVLRSFSESGFELFNSPDTIYVHGTARDLLIVAGNEQSQTVNGTLAPLRVRLVENSQGIAGEAIIFELMQGDAAFIDSPDQKTDADGYAQINVRLGAQAGEIKIRAMAPAFSASVTFTSRGLPDKPSALRKISGDEQTGIAHHPLNQKIAVQLTDQYGNGITAHVVRFELQAGHGVITPTSHLETDANGFVHAGWHLGSVTPRQSVLVKSASEDATFTAHVLENQSPVISTADSFFTAENEKLQLLLPVMDAEHDSLAIVMQNGPNGAIFNPVTAMFSWTPSYEQAGLHWATFQARDIFGAASTKSIKIRVENSNRPPTIAAEQCRPLGRRLGKIKIPAIVDFYVHATDPDGDILHYIWQVNGIARSASKNYRLSTQSTGSGPVTVKALVFDQQDTVASSWTLEVVTAVELKSFSAIHAPYTGIKLTWESRYEWDNAGFYVLRAAQQGDPYEAVSYFIESRANGKYDFIDRDIEAGISYFYRIQDVQSNGARHESEIIQIAAPLPKQFALHQNYPNPFNPATSLLFDIAEPCPGSLVIYDILGRKVRTLIEGDLAPGFHKIEWDGANEYGKTVASGLYHAVLHTEKGQFVKKMAMVR
ncbi:VCBS repeat-containing protein [candidate division KSB1 bacterium]|nr:VCBS repeat-containing protein [candidate division KSB1 bacterium]